MAMCHQEAQSVLVKPPVVSPARGVRGGGGGLPGAVTETLTAAFTFLLLQPIRVSESELFMKSQKSVAQQHI